MNRCNRFSKQVITVLSFTASLALMSGCGMQYAGSKSATSNYDWQTIGSSGSGNNSTGSGSTATITGTGSASSIRIDGVGTNPRSFNVSTKTKLRIRFTPGRNDKNIANTGYSPQYSKLSARIYIGNSIYETGFLQNGVSGSVQNVVLDLSADLPDTAACPKASTSNCRNSVQVVLNEPKYDLVYGYYGYNATPVYYSHPWNASIQIETDDSGTL